MEYTTLGDTGLSVSRLGLGGVSFGSGQSWMLDEAESRTVIERALDLGITLFDTANAYSAGESERILGGVLAEHDRDRLVVATKAFFPMGEDPNARGLSRKALGRALTGSLDRLGMATIDLNQGPPV